MVHAFAVHFAYPEVEVLPVELQLLVLCLNTSKRGHIGALFLQQMVQDFGVALQDTVNFLLHGFYRIEHYTNATDQH